MNDKKRAVHVATITRRQNGKTYVTHLLRHTYRENGKVKQLTLGNLSDLPDDLIRVIRNRLSGQGLPVQSFQCLLKDLGTLCKNRVCWKSSPDVVFDRLTEPTALQRHVFGLLGIAIGQ